MARILIVEDEPEIREMIRYVLAQEDFSISEAAHAQDARQLLTTERFDLILMDWLLPGRSGLELIRELKQKAKTKTIPIIMLTARTDESCKIDGLESGADDYITKPFSPRELVARIRAVLRRAGYHSGESPVELGGLRIEPASHLVLVNGARLDLSPSEYRLLFFFMTHQERAYTRSQILDQVWGDDVYLEERTVDVHIRRLRKFLEPSHHDHLIQTVRGVGYRFTAED
ncbi:MAG: phosphate regulon transcriptional regulator PhoB [Pseudomonadota bacterium]